MNNPNESGNEGDVQHGIDNIEAVAAANANKLGLFSDWTQLYEPIDSLVDQIVRDILSGVPENEIDKTIERIKGRRDKLSLSSGIKDKIVSICQQILAFGAAGVALTVGFIDKVRLFSPTVQKSLAIVGIFYSELILLSLLVLIWYLLQARFRFPYLYFEKTGNAWPFFYYASITQVARAPLQLPKTRFAASVAYGKDFVRFAKRIVTESPRDRLRAELQQYFLLMSYQAYVHQFSLRLANLFMYGFIGSVLTAVIMFILVAGGVL
jgi:hypothetical protein